MSRKLRIASIVAVLVLALAPFAGRAISNPTGSTGVSIPGRSPGPAALALPSGFEATIFAQGLDRPRFMACYAAIGCQR